MVGDARAPRLGELESFLEVPRNGLALATRIGRQDDVVRALDDFAQPREHVLAALGDLILKSEDEWCNAHAVARQIAHVLDTRGDEVVVAVACALPGTRR
ncbi:hypothetical protein BI364_13645 [Acidihalobacter yilgarnensis]|uniref:Uncharacterized protein n=1 Tax=Acidihalobacter yilgarnensis TaxID=2819280 RepID=A0A1D8IQV2_9GAMM|nr:hypothetical protein BI364_13645 [Acidihalobacter yilgarnensis]